MYADDSCNHCSISSRYTETLRQCSVYMYADSDTIVYNEIKTTFMHFRLNLLHNLFIPTMFLDKSKLNVKEIKCFGVILNVV